MRMTQPEKKSEMLELRITPSEKDALQKRAKAEGRAVSAVVRQAVSNYLATPLHPIMPRLRKGWAALAGGVMAVSAALGLSGLAHAETLQLDVAASLVTPEGEGVRTRSSDFTLHIEDQEPVEFITEHADGSAILGIEVRATRLSDSEVRLDIVITDPETGEVIGSPFLMTELGTRASLEVGATEDRAASYSVSILPTVLD